MLPARPSSRPNLPEQGASLRGYQVIARRAADTVAARSVDGAIVDLVFGDPVDLAHEAHALRTVAPRMVVPEVVAVERHEAHGTFLVLGDRGHAEISATLTAAEVYSALRAIVDLARTLETAGFSWAPSPDDLAIDGARVDVRRLRGAVRLGPRERLDARSAIETFGAALVDRARALPLGLLRVMLPRRSDDERTVEALEQELSAAASLLVAREEDESIGACTDVGLVREQNEDAVRTLRSGELAIAVVCDGVSASRDAQLAAEIASHTTLVSLLERRGEPPVETMRDAIRGAHEAICDVHARRGNEPLGTTIVAARVEGRRVTIGWVGDSRAYFVPLSSNEPVQLTRDHSWLSDALAAGTAPEEAVRSPFAHALTRCLGPLEGGDEWHAEPDVVDLELEGAGYLILCSDGLWNYTPTANDLAVIAGPAIAQRSAGAIARTLCAAALARGGQDNVTVAVVEIPGTRLTPA